MFKIDGKVQLLAVCLAIFFNTADAIIGGEVAQNRQFKYMVAIKTTIDGLPRICGGSLIEDTFILTAARCLSNASEVQYAPVGQTDWNNRAIFYTVPRSDDNFIIHEDYSSEHGVKHDIGLIVLKSKPVLPLLAESVALPKFTDYFKTYDEQTGTVSGYGKYQETEEKANTKLRYANLTIIPLLDCEISYLFQLSPDQMCTSGVGDQNICLGDAGSPLVVDGVQVGIASYGSPFGCNAGFPAVYTRLTSYMDWLNGGISSALKSRKGLSN